MYERITGSYEHLQHQGNAHTSTALGHYIAKVRPKIRTLKRWFTVQIHRARYLRAGCYTKPHVLKV